MWTQDPECREHIDLSQDRWHNETKIRKINNNIRKVTQSLKKWNKKNFENFKTQLNENKKKLKDLYNSNIIEQTKKEIDNVKKLIKELGKKDDVFWIKKSRINWLKWDDKILSSFTC